MHQEPKRKRSDSWSPSTFQSDRNRNSPVDDEEGYLIIRPNTWLQDYYTVKLLGQGTFGKVIEAEHGPRRFAVSTHYLTTEIISTDPTDDRKHRKIYICSKEGD